MKEIEVCGGRLCQGMKPEKRTWKKGFVPNMERWPGGMAVPKLPPISNVELALELYGTQ